MTLRTKITIVIVYTAVAVAVGRYTVPEKVKIETKIVEVEKKIDDKKSDTVVANHKKIITHEVDKPSGEKEITTITSDDDDTETKVDNKEIDDTAKLDTSNKEITGVTSHTVISVLGGYDLNLNRLVYGGSVTKPVLGPITIGIWVLTEPAAGASIGLQF